MERGIGARVPALDRVPQDTATVAGTATPLAKKDGTMNAPMRAPAHAFAERVLVMAQGYDKSLGMIAKILRAQSNQVPLEPLPERWVDLIHQPE